jgi:serine/threonine-protein kinase
MTPERFREVDRLLDLALEKAPDERSAFIRQACAGDEQLHRELESLLACRDRASGFMAEPPTDIASAIFNREDPQEPGRERVMPATLPSGALVGRYTVLGPLGGGGMGIVYAAHDPELDRKVAIKLVRPDASGGVLSNDRRARLLREAQAMARLSHPNVIGVYDVGSYEDQVFVAMEYVEGSTLTEWLGAKKKRSWREVLSTFIQSGRGLAAAHAASIVHRDFKPDNVFVGKDGRVRVLDFGLARAAASDNEAAVIASCGVHVEKPSSPTPSPGSMLGISMSRSGVLHGTPTYMAPEQFQGLPADGRTDQFSFCVALYEALYGDLPFRGDSVDVLVTEILQGNVKAPARGVAPSWLLQTLLRGLRPDPATRYPSMDSLLDQLERKATSSRAVLLGVAGFLLTSLLLLTWQAWEKKRAIAPIRSIAVLPLENATDDSAQEFFADGFTEGVMDKLAQISSLRVIARDSVMRYKKSPKLLPEIGRELDVDWVLRGRVARSRGRVTVSAELVQPATERHLWGRNYERDSSDVLLLESQLVRDILVEVKVKVNPAEQAQLASAQSVDPELYEAYLQGEYFVSKSTETSVRTGMSYFEQVLAKNPSYAPAFVGLSRAYMVLESPLSALPLHDSMRAAKDAVTQALALDDSLADAHARLATIRHRYDWDWAGAEKEFRRAIALNPGRAYSDYGYYLRTMGRHEEGCAELKRAQQQDPISPQGYIGLAKCFAYMKQYDRALEQYQKGIQLNPAYPRTHAFLSGFYALRGRYGEAFEELQKSNETFGRVTPWHQAVLAYYHALGGNKAEAEKLLDVLKETPLLRQSNFVLTMAKAYAALDRRDEAFEWLEKGFRARSSMMVDLNLDPGLEPLRLDPRFQDLLGRIGLPH